MARYELVRLLGEGSFGEVYQAIDTFTNQYVAIKKLKQPYVDDPAAEVRALIRLKHPNIVRLEGVFQEGNTDYLVFEFMEGSLGDLIRKRRMCNLPFSEDEIRLVGFQVLQGLAFMHDQGGYMHRDLKPDNILVNQGVVKISDLGSAEELESDELLFRKHYVTTRWYRAPEMLLRTFVKNEKLRPFDYDEKVDMWAMGAILAELLLMVPLFMGESSPHQLEEICKVMGAPTRESWQGGMFTMNIMKWPKLEPENGVGLRALMPYASVEAVDLIEALCSWDPMKRPSAREALQHPFFNVAASSRFSNCTMNNSVTRMTKSLTMLPILGV